MINKKLLMLGMMGLKAPTIPSHYTKSKKKKNDPGYQKVACSSCLKDFYIEKHKNKVDFCRDCQRKIKRAGKFKII